MPRLATCLSSRGAGSGRGVEGSGRGRHRRSAAVLDAAGTLNTLAPRGAGWAMPRIDSIAHSYVTRRGDPVAAAVGMGLLRAGVAPSSTWQAAKGDALEFVRSAITQFIERHGGPSIRDTFRLHTLLTGSLNDYSQSDREITAAQLYLSVEPFEAGYVVLGPAVRLLEEVHPRLPATFLHLLLGALNRWIRVYDHRDAREQVERLREWYSTDPDCETVDLPDVEASVPLCLREQPLRPRELRGLLSSLSPETRDWTLQALELERLSRRRARPRLSQQMEEALGDSNPPLPSLLVVFTPGDNIEACFDEEAQSMMEVPPEPNLIIPFDGTNSVEIRRGFGVLETACETLAAAAALIRSLPGSGGK